MEFPDINPDDVKHAGELMNTAAKSFLGKKLISSIGNYFNRRSKQKDSQAALTNEDLKVVTSAEAEVKADLVRFNAELEKGGLLADYIKRSGSHLISERIRKDFNIDSTIGMAFDQLENKDSKDNDHNEEPLEEDWFARWTSTVENISEEKVQRIWASILAGEVKAPGSFSLRSLDIIHNLSKAEAETFTKLCNFVLSTSGGRLKFVFTKDSESLPEIEETIGFHGVRLLEEAGLISSGSSTIFGGLSLKLFPNKTANVAVQYSYGDSHIQIVPKADMLEDYEGSIITLTQAGKELHSIINITKSDRYLESIKNIYLSKTENFSMSVHNIVSRTGSTYQYIMIGRVIH